MTPRLPTEAELHAFIDGELDPVRRDEVARAVQDDPALAAAIAAFVEDGERLRSALSPAAAMPLDPAWIGTIERALVRPPPNRSTRPWPTRRSTIAAGFAAAACAATVLAYRRMSVDGDILARAEFARSAGHGTTAVETGDPRRDAILQAQTGVHVHAPDLRHFGFDLAAVTLFGRTGSGAAQLSYHDRAGRLLTIFVRSSDGRVRFDLLRRGDLRVCVWQDDVVGAVIIAPMRAGEMLRIASNAYSSLNL